MKIHRQYNKLIICIGILFVILPNVYGQDIRFSAGRVSSTFAEGNEQTILQNNAEVENDDLRITAETIRLTGEDNRYISAEGSILLQDKENNVELRAEFLNFDSEEEILVLEGTTQFISEEDDIKITSTFLERQPDLVVFQLNVEIVREDMLANAEYVRYFEDSKRLELSGFPIVYYQNDEYSASVITVYTETNEIILEGEVRGQLSDTESDDENSDDSSSGDENSDESNSNNDSTSENLEP